MDFNLKVFNLVVMQITGHPEFDLFFSLVFELGLIFFVMAEPLRMFLNRIK